MQLDLFQEAYVWVMSPRGKPMYREYPGVKGTGITVGEMIRSGLWTKDEACMFLCKGEWEVDEDGYKIVPRITDPYHG